MVVSVHGDCEFGSTGGQLQFVWGLQHRDVSTKHCSRGAAAARYRSKRMVAALVPSADYWLDRAHRLLGGGGTTESVRGLGVEIGYSLASVLS